MDELIKYDDEKNYIRAILDYTKAIHVKNYNGETFFTAKKKNTLRQVKARIYLEEGINPNDQHLFFNGEELTDEHTALSELGITDGSTITLVRFT